jgi:pyruvate formate lyase activating enzyme
MQATELTLQTKEDYCYDRKERMISRREFLITSTAIGPMLVHPAFACTTTFDKTDDLIRTSPKARYWISTASPGINCRTCHGAAIPAKTSIHTNGPVVIIKCLLCAQVCMLKPGERGKCRARINSNGELRSLVYGRPVTMHVDPIEKKPFYHFLPGSNAFSFATAGCPLHCKFCQNWEISQSRPEDYDTDFVPPAKIVTAASSRQSPVIAFTYNEPTVFIEYLADTAVLAKKNNLRCVMISCGFMNSEPLKEMCGLLDAIKIDLKGFSPDFYRNVCGAELQPVLNSIRQIAKSGIHLEIVNLVVPTLNDSEKMMKELVDWIMGEIGPDVPIHFTRFHPDYQLRNLPPTPVATLERFRNHAMSKGINYPYIGNVPDHPGNNTYCPQCNKAVIQRNSIFITGIAMERGKCKFCGRPIAGVWS